MQTEEHRIVKYIRMCICIITLTSHQYCVGRLAGRNLKRCNLADNQRHAARIYDAAVPLQNGMLRQSN